MSISVTLHVFSGRPNPVWTLSDAQADELTDRVAALRTQTNVKSGVGTGGLGYRGFSIGRAETPFATHIHEGIVDPGEMSPSLLSGDRELEQWLLGTGDAALADAVKEHVRSAIQVPPPANLLKTMAPAPPACPPCLAADAPRYAPGNWNTPSVQPHNNCYNYANDRVTNTFAQPGRATGKPITALSCGGVQPSAVSDGLVPSANFATPLAQGRGWYVALVIWPGQDYHWYRQDDGGCWSHKPGQTAARNTDNAGATIRDPNTCNRGPYTNFCTYMVTTRSVNIR